MMRSSHLSIGMFVVVAVVVLGIVALPAVGAGQTVVDSLGKTIGAYYPEPWYDTAVMNIGGVYLKVSVSRGGFLFIDPPPNASVPLQHSPFLYFTEPDCHGQPILPFPRSSLVPRLRVWGTTGYYEEGGVAPSPISVKSSVLLGSGASCQNYFDPLGTTISGVVPRTVDLTVFTPPFSINWSGSDSGLGAKTKIGIYRNGNWYLDKNGNGVLDGGGTEEIAWGGAPGDTPVIGDWDGTGPTRIGIYRNGMWYLDLNGNGIFDDCPVGCISWGGDPADVPVVGKW